MSSPASGTADPEKSPSPPSGPWRAERVGTAADRIVILGGGTRGREVARAAAAVGTVHHLDARESTVDGPEGYTARHVPDVESAAGLATVSFEPGDTVIVATPSDRRNLLITQHVRTKFDVDRVLVVVNDPQNHPALELPGVACLCLSTLLGDAVAGAISGAEEKSA